jgi:tRNA pseudouridine55 synthase
MSDLNGILNLDKPLGFSSAYALTRLKRLLPKGTKVGHAGTLDPFASGVLIVLIGKATKLSQSWMDQPKEYLASIKFGATTTTLDPDSPEIPMNPAPQSVEEIQNILPQFIGVIQQSPPDYSAIKLSGKPAYEIARKGKTLDLPVRPVRVDCIEIFKYEPPILEVKIQCGKGTYIRSIARDMGIAMNTGGYLTQLRRSAIGNIRVEDSLKLDELTLEKVAASLKVITPTPA